MKQMSQQLFFWEIDVTSCKYESLSPIAVIFSDCLFLAPHSDAEKGCKTFVIDLRSLLLFFIRKFIYVQNRK